MSTSEWERGYAAGYAAGYMASGEHRVTYDKVRMSSTPPAKKKRKVSAYSKRYGAAYKSLKAKHPRMSFGALSKKAHKQARRK